LTTAAHVIDWRLSAAGRFVLGAALAVASGSGAAFATNFPFNLIPSNGAVVAGTSVYFEWTEVTGSSEYWLQISGVPTFAAENLNLNQSVGYNRGATISQFPNNGIVLYWRAAAYNADQGGWSSFSTPTYFVNGAPSAPALTNPANGAGVPGTTLPFDAARTQRPGLNLDSPGGGLLPSAASSTIPPRVPR
jgi:hypothetical protein